MSALNHAPTPLLDPTPSNLWRAAACIRQGGVVAVPNDTAVALAVDPTRPDAVERLDDVTRRSPDEPLTLFVRDPSRWRTYGRPDDDGVAERIVESCWPGPPVVVVDATDRVPHDRLRRDGTVSVGCVANPTWRQVTAHLDGPLAMVAANRSDTTDDAAHVDVDAARDHVGDGVDLFVDADPPENATRATTIVDVTDGPRDLPLDDLEPVIDAV